MTKKAPATQPKTKAAPYGWLFVIIWPIVTSLLINNDLFTKLDITTATWVIAVIVLAPIAAVLLPLLYQMAGNLGSIPVVAAWKRVTFSIIATSLFLCVFGYLYLLISFAVATNS